MNQLDGLRAFAVFAVLISHFVPSTYAWVDLVPWGTLGVELFFVLSGFLITGILLVCRDSYHTIRDSFWGLRQFYIRRFLRIFPLYYFVLCVIFLLNVADIRQTFLWYATYLSNIKFAVDQHWAESLSHFWSLAVEEQFYFVWPLVILFCPRQVMPSVMVAVILLAPITRWIAFAQGNLMAMGVLMPSNLDALGLGGLLALLKRRHRNVFWSNRRWIVWMGAISGLMAIGLHVALVNSWLSPIPEILFSLFLGMFYFGLIGQSSYGLGGVGGKILRAPVVTYLGKISYGIYVYHNFIPSFVQTNIDPFINLPSPYRGVVAVLLSFGITILIASVSWYIMERPLNDLRRYFKYSPRSEMLARETV